MSDRDAGPVAPDAMAQAKQSARVVARAMRAQCHERIGPAAAPAITTHLLSLLPAIAPRGNPLVIAGYWPKGDEVDVGPALSALGAAGHATALPVVTGRAWPLIFRLWRPGHPLVPGAFQVMEPMAEAPLAQPDIVLVPMLAFDDRGYRLGYGGGFYDRTLEVLRAEAPTVAVGIAYAGQRLESLPVDAYDERLDWIVTEAGVNRPA